MSDPSSLSSIPPGVDAAQWLKAQRQMALAQTLQGFALTPAQDDLRQPAGGGKYYQAARVGKLSVLSKLAEAMMAKRGFDQALPAMQQQYSQGMQAFAPGNQETPGTPLQAQAPPMDANQQSVQPALQRAPGQSFEQTVQGSQPSRTPINPYNPQGLPPAVMMRLYQSDPAKYASMIAGPEAVQLGQAAGIPRQQAAQAAFAKSNSISARAGEDVMIPDGKGGYTHVRNPVLSAGEAPVTDAQGNVVGVQGLPGHLPYQTALTGAETGAREQNTPRMIPQGGGVEALGYPPTPPALRQPGQPPKQYFGGSPPQSPMPQPPPSARAAPTQGQASQGLWSDIPKLSVPNTPGQTTDAFHQQLLKESASKHAELVNKYGQEADLSDQKMQYNAQAMKALPGAEVGPLSDWLTTHRQGLVEAGIPASMIPGSGTVTPTLELNKYLKNTALQGARAIYGARMTQTEVKLQTDEMSPSAHMTRDAIASLMQQDNIRNGYAKQRSNDYSQYVQQGGDPMQFERWYASKRPLTRYAAQYTTPKSATDRLQQNPSLLPDFKAKYGWDPNQ